MTSTAARPGTQPRILVVEDDTTVAEVVSRYLVREGFDVEQTDDGAVALAKLQLVSDVPIIMLTALGETGDRIAGLEIGADDYLAKPFSPRELVARVKNVLKRANGGRDDRHVLEVAGLTLNRKSREVVVNDTPVDLTQREFDLLAFLMEHPEEVITREVLLEHVWGYSFGDTSTVTVHVRRLREKIEPEPSTPTYVQTVWGVGYKFGG
jgi:DNA-binding response OmpR family regulator